jgi:long-chain acyl-CoA synthetase
VRGFVDHPSEGRGRSGVRRPNADLGEEVKAVVQPMPGLRPSAELAEELILFCRDHLAHMKCPRSIDFEAELPRLHASRIV